MSICKHIVQLMFLAIMLSGNIRKENAMNDQRHAVLNDGPYLIYDGTLLHVKYIAAEKDAKVLRHDSMSIDRKAGLPLRVNTDIPGMTFEVRIKDKIVNEKSEYKKASRQLIMSDIEGNFAAFRKLLQSAGVVDERLEWTFGDGHLVLAGDFFDRGNQVTETLWLIYALEEKARKSGGHVHFILGNHDIMNMSADLRYLNPKYLENARLMHVDYNSLYGNDSELGRWLRSKNIIEKIGGNLYVHGGISRQMNFVGWEIPEINEKARPFYSDTTYRYPNIQTEVLFSDYGPFWFRGCYMPSPDFNRQVLDSTLKQFRIQRVITGHTPIADAVSAFYDGKLINVDTPHAKGKSEALLLEGGGMFIIRPDGYRAAFVY